MNIFRARHDNVPESPVRTLYGRKGNFLLLPLDVCVLQTVNGIDEFRPSPEVTRLIAAPIQDELDGRVAPYVWSPARNLCVSTKTVESYKALRGKARLARSRRD